LCSPFFFLPSTSLYFYFLLFRLLTFPKDLSPDEKPPSIFPRVTITQELGETIANFFLPQWEGIVAVLKEEHPSYPTAELDVLVSAMQKQQKKANSEKEKK
jgi:hypothetical protein